MDHLQIASDQAIELHVFFKEFFWPLASLLVVIQVIQLVWGAGVHPKEILWRLITACILLVGFPYFLDLLESLTDSLCSRIGDFSSVDKMQEKLSEYWTNITVSWTSLKQTIMVVICFLGFFALYVTKVICEGAFSYCWLLCYCLSPVLIALHVHPATAGSTKKLFQSLIEICLWKVGWLMISALVWGNAFSQINASNTNVLSVVVMNLLLVASMLAVPFIVNSLVSGQISSVGKAASAVASTSIIGPASAVYSIPKRQVSKIISKAVKKTRPINRRECDGEDE